MANHSTVKDTGAFFTIVPETRQVTVPQTHKIIGVVGDHMAEQLTFEIPQIIDGHDIAGCARRYVSWLNVDDVPGNDTLEELTERPEGAKEGMLYFTWTVRDLLAAIKGLVQFSLHFEDVDANGERLYHWGTTNCKNCEILDSVNNALGAYAAIYVAEDTLIFSDYNAVEGKTLELETPGIVPEGTVEVSGGGTYDCGKYAQVRVVETFETPTISVDGSTGQITAEANDLEATHQLGAEDCADFVAANILKGKNVLGVTGTLEITPANLTIIVNSHDAGTVTVLYNTAQGATLSAASTTVSPGGYQTLTTCIGGIVVLVSYADGYWTFDETKNPKVEKLFHSTSKKMPLVVKVKDSGSLVVGYTYTYTG